MSATIQPTLTVQEAASQSLASGAVGAALLAIERALNGNGDWATAHVQIKRATAGPVDAAPPCRAVLRRAGHRLHAPRRQRGRPPTLRRHPPDT